MEDVEYSYIKSQVKKLTGVDLNCYKAPQMQRRLKAYLVRSGQPNWPKFFRAVRANPADLSKFKDYLTINVSSFFRDSEKYKYLQTSVLPELLRHHPSLRVWSAGCSRGQEAYSLAILLAEAGNHSGGQHRLLATDIDQSALEWARAGGPYSADEVTKLSPDLRLRYFEVRQEEYWVKEELKRRIAFKPHNLLADPIVGKFDLIVCRNVVIYFEADAKEKLYCRFYDALKPEGVLFVGGTEIVPRATDMGFEAINVSFYRRKLVTLTTPAKLCYSRHVS
ncbi:MAG: protein-glutamate O-methyltransferase CheR [Anaerolineae bacterium]|nr:protein-glutamate O-methyltransferase CheR [Anaerolineae bacterium]